MCPKFQGDETAFPENMWKPTSTSITNIIGIHRLGQHSHNKYLQTRVSRSEWYFHVHEISWLQLHHFTDSLYVLPCHTSLFTGTWLQKKGRHVTEVGYVCGTRCMFQFQWNIRMMSICGCVHYDEMHYCNCGRKKSIFPWKLYSSPLFRGITCIIHIEDFHWLLNTTIANIMLVVIDRPVLIQH